MHRLVSCVLSIIAAGVVSASERPLNLGADVVLDADGRTVFYRDEEGRTHARNVDDGRLKWSTDLPARPIALLGAQLLVQVESRTPGEASLRWLGAASGAKGKEVALALAQDVTAHLDPRAESQFDFTQEITSGDLLLHWRYSASPSRGALMLNAEAETQVRTGASELKPGASTASARTDAVEPSGTVYALTISERLAGLGERQFRSVDGQHVMVSEAIADAAFASRYRWRIFGLSGNALGEYESLHAFTPFLVSDNTLLLRAAPYIQRLNDGSVQSAPERLLAVDLKTSAVRWTTTVMDPVYRGVLPP